MQQPLLDPYGSPQLVGPRALAGRRAQQPYGSGGMAAPDPTAFFNKYLAAYGLAAGDAAGAPANPQTVDQYEATAKRLERFAAMGKRASDTFAGMGAASGMFLDQLNNTNRVVGRLELGASQERLGAQVFAGGPGDWTNSLRGWGKAIQQQQSVGGTYDSLPAAAQEAAGLSAFTNLSRGALAAPLDASTMMANDPLRKTYGNLLNQAVALRQMRAGDYGSTADWAKGLGQMREWNRRLDATTPRAPVGRVV